ncbi:uncharacterized protein LOC113337378 [Papaver somniferum]|uniref:uncharacterized protein LOC113337378 n=1 Tax=Papaver somniferum TaxID=3469 RepID=UPI000E6F97DC|nr:uncharacterized protein LOC113337378 [Papaver somniferum]
MKDFRNYLETCKLLQASRSGKKRILYDLDKAFYNTKWLELYEAWCYIGGVRCISDHGALLGGVVNLEKPRNITFRYHSVWTTHPDFLKVIAESWIEECSGNHAVIFLNKLKRLKHVLKKWNCEVFGDLRIKLKQDDEEVLSTTLLSNVDPENIELLNNLVTARGKQEIVSKQYNELMRAKSRVKWVKEGGANTAFFHTCTRIRKTQNNIFELENADGTLVIEQNQIFDILVTHYENKFEAGSIEFAENIFEVIPKVLSEEDNFFLDDIPSSVEIKDAVFAMDANGAPGPDGYPGCFYRYAWKLLELN